MPTPKLLENFSETELHIVQQTLKERFGTDLSVIEADAEVKLDPASPELTERPILFWESPEDNSKFILMKIGLDQYKCQFFYRGYQQYSTNCTMYDNIGDCVIDLLQVYSTHQTPNSVLDK